MKNSHGAPIQRVFVALLFLAIHTHRLENDIVKRRSPESEPRYFLAACAAEFAEILRKKGVRVPDLAMAGGFSSEDGVYKAIALGSPYFKAVCMGRGLMIPGFVGKNIGKWLDEDKLPKTVAKFGHKLEEIFIHYEELRDKYGSEMKNIPLGAIGIFTYSKKFQVGLQQLMAGSRNFNLSTISRSDLIALTEDAARISGISFVMDGDIPITLGGRSAHNSKYNLESLSTNSISQSLEDT